MPRLCPRPSLPDVNWGQTSGFLLFAFLLVLPRPSLLPGLFFHLGSGLTLFPRARDSATESLEGHGDYGDAGKRRPKWSWPGMGRLRRKHPGIESSGCQQPPPPPTTDGRPECGCCSRARRGSRQHLLTSLESATRKSVALVLT